MFNEKEEIDRLADEATLLHMIIGYPTLTFRKFGPIQPMEEGKPYPKPNIESYEVQWHDLNFEHRKFLVESYLKDKENNETEDEQYHKFLTRKLTIERNVAIISAVAVFLAAVIIFGR